MVTNNDYLEEDRQTICKGIPNELNLSTASILAFKFIPHDFTCMQPVFSHSMAMHGHIGRHCTDLMGKHVRNELPHSPYSSDISSLDL
jgi:hypothetical protein